VKLWQCIGVCALLASAAGADETAPRGQRRPRGTESGNARRRQRRARAAPSVQPAGPITTEADNFDYDPARDTVILTGSPRITQGVNRLTADRIEYQQATQQATAAGNVVVTLGPDEIHAAAATYNFATHEGRAEAASTVSNEVQIRAEEILVTPELWTANRAHLTSCMGAHPDWELTAHRVELTPGVGYTAYTASINMFGARVATVARVSRPLHQPGESELARQLIRYMPTFGYDKRDGAYLQDDVLLFRRPTFYSRLDARLSTGRGITGRLETAQSRKFGWVADLGYREDAPNQRARYLEYSQLPEVGLVYAGVDDSLQTGPTVGHSRTSRFLPSQVGNISIKARPETMDQWRWAGEVTAGYFQQLKGLSSLPQNVNMDGERLLIQGQVARPRLRLGALSLESLRLMLRGSTYDTGNAYGVAGFGIRKSARIGPLTVALEQLTHYTAGHTPFLFDAVELNNELRPRAELKVRGWDFSWIGRINEANTTFYDQHFAVTHRLDCMQIRLGYDTRLSMATFDLRLLGLETPMSDSIRPEEDEEARPELKPSRHPRPESP